ncbi:recombinase family protein [Monoglobus pectinilyticus]|uniref:recombinase family protein n=2 Tax=Monoglobus pectinilyticus TaxID=1981510 RepID=UPI002E7703E9|nr:recombinase family protein [Monoglobus pectinilyticus]MEE0734230.1 recombinase family protein [Monoglobus pectinilyticus]
MSVSRKTLIFQCFQKYRYLTSAFERPDFKRMVADIEKGLINIVIVKDLSRLGRNNAMVALYTEMIFPDNDVRFIAINDNIDTTNGDNDIMPFKSVVNEFYAKDISKKIRSAYRVKALNGEFTAAFAPYGYQKDPNNKYKLIPDENTADNVRRIFRLAAEGISPYKISMILSNDKILKPRAYFSETTGRYTTAYDNEHPFGWCNCTVTTIIKNRVYLGHMVNNKSTTKSYKNRKVVKNSPEEWIEVKNTHEPLVDEETWELAQKIIGKKKRPMKTGEIQIFSGLVKCSTCGCSLTLAKQKDRKGNGSFACSKSRKYGKEYCSFHYMRYDNLYKIVLEDIRKHAKIVENCEQDFIEAVTEFKLKKQKEQCLKNEKNIEKAKLRLTELENIIRCLYEDRVKGKISDTRFNILSEGYEQEEEKIKEDINIWQGELNIIKDTKEQTKRFSECVKKYINIEELTAPLLNELIEKIVVHDPKEVDGVRTQKVEIFYRFIGILNE